MTTRRASDNTKANAKALDAFMITKFQIDAMLERLKARSDDHFETHPDEINWGHVATVNHYASLLRQIIAMLQRPEGTTIAEIVAATAWQAHSARGLISGVLKKKLGLAKEDGRGAVYRIG